jgi:hypothetical protein
MCLRMVYNVYTTKHHRLVSSNPLRIYIYVCVYYERIVDCNRIICVYYYNKNSILYYIALHSIYIYYIILYRLCYLLQYKIIK